MNKPTLYLETTVPSYLAARPSRDIVIQAHQQITWDWWKSCKENYEVYISEIVLKEIAGGDQKVAKKRHTFVKDLEILDLSEDVYQLARDLAVFLRLPKRAEMDALHLSFAVEYELDYLLTWNCAHLANGAIIRRLKKFESDHTRFVPVIVTPEELMIGGYENEMD